MWIYVQPYINVFTFTSFHVFDFSQWFTKSATDNKKPTSAMLLCLIAYYFVCEYGTQSTVTELSQQWRWSIFLIMSAYRVNSPWIAYTTRHASNAFIMMPVLVSENIIRLYRVIVDRWTLILWVSILSNAVSKRKLLLLIGCSLLISKLDYGLYIDHCVCDTCVLWRWCFQE